MSGRGRGGKGRGGGGSECEGEREASAWQADPLSSSLTSFPLPSSIFSGITATSIPSSPPETLTTFLFVRFSPASQSLAAPYVC